MIIMSKLSVCEYMYVGVFQYQGCHISFCGCCKWPSKFMRKVMKIALLPPAFRRNGKGNVCTGVCLFTPGGGGDTAFQPTGEYLPSSRWVGGGGTYLPADGGGGGTYFG